MVKEKEKKIKSDSLGALMDKSKEYDTVEEVDAFMKGCIEGIKATGKMFDAIYKDNFKSEDVLDVEDKKFFENVINKVKG